MALTAEQLAVLSKGLTTEDMAALTSLFQKSDDGAGDQVADVVEPGVNPTADVMLGLYDAVAAISKSATGDKTAALNEVFEKAFEALSQAVAEQNSVAAAAAVSEVKKGKKYRTMKQLYKAFKAGKLHTNEKSGAAGDGRDHTDNEDKDADETRPDAMSDNDDEYSVGKIMKIAKSFGDSPVGRYLTELAKRHDALQKVVNQMADERTTEVFNKRAADVGETPEFAKLLKSLAGVKPELADQVANIVKTKNEAITKGGLFSSIGGGQSPDGTGAMHQLNTFATEIVKASNGKKQFAKAFLEACQQHPDLYRQSGSDTARFPGPANR